MAQVGFIGILLSNTTFVWFAYLFECYYLLLNDFAAFIDEFHPILGDLYKECTSTRKLKTLCQRSLLVMVYAF
jgi:hypothetical protein